MRKQPVFEIEGLGMVMPLPVGAKALGIGNSTLRRMAKSGVAVTLKIGRSRRISEAEITRLASIALRKGAE